jgi:hypothetical protein
MERAVVPAFAMLGAPDARLATDTLAACFEGLFLRRLAGTPRSTRARSSTWSSAPAWARPETPLIRSVTVRSHRKRFHYRGPVQD